MDTVFLASVLIILVGGALFLIDLASARSSGQETTGFNQFLSQIPLWMPAIGGFLAKYGMLFLMSVVNSALIVLLVTALRTLDQKVGRLANRRKSRFGPMRKMHDLRRAREVAAAAPTDPRDFQSYLLSPVFR
jgi:hypothetical protein